MRNEYIEAVNAVRGGWTYWIIFVLPACLIWLTMLLRPFRPHRYLKTILTLTFLLACYIYADRTIYYVERIQHTKEANMKTEAEIQDWSSDTWRVFAKLTAMPIALFFCTCNLIAAGLVRLFIKSMYKEWKLIFHTPDAPAGG
jgi:hypothetical protein